MRRESAILLVVVSMIVAASIGGIAQETSLVPAAVFPYDIVGENYVPSLYFSAYQSEDERLVVAPNFPYVTCDLCYSPSLYYEAWKIRAMQAMK
jgi:hypothetical protein